MQDELMTVSQVASLFEVSPQTVYHWINSRWIASEKQFGRVLIKKSDAETILNEGYAIEPNTHPRHYPRILSRMRKVS